MECLRICSKFETFHREGQTLICTTGLPSDITIEVGEMSFRLHKFPLISRSGLLKTLIEEHSSENESVCVLRLHDVPGGAKTFELVTKFCYGVKIELTALNVVSLRCAAEYFQMNESYGEGNLIAQTESFLDKVFGNWTDSIKALETCEEVLPSAQELHIVSRCIDSLAMKACADTKLFNWPVAGCNSVTVSWNGTRKPAQPRVEDWWFEDVSVLSFPFFKQLIRAVESRGMKPESIAGSLAYYAKRHIPVMDRQLSFNATNSTLSDAHQRTLLEEIVELLPNEKGATSAKFLLRLLRTGMILNVNPSCRENLERRVGIHLDQVALEDLLIPNMGYSMETLYDIDCVQRIVDRFTLTCQATSTSYSPKVMSGSDTLRPMTLVADLVDGYLAEVAPDVNLKLLKFHALAAAIPDYARPLNDSLYHAIDVYLKAHPWLTDSERGQLCGLMNWQKLSLDASTHAAQNERLPLRVIVQVLFFEQLRLRTSISGWLFVSDSLEHFMERRPLGTEVVQSLKFKKEVKKNSQNLSSNLGLPRNEGPCKLDPAQDRVVGVSEVKERVFEIEKECLSMKQELEKLAKRKKSWRFIPLKFFARLKLHPVKEASAMNEEQNNKNDCMPQ